MTNDSVPEDENATFADLGLRAELLGVLAELGYEEPTPIQRETIPELIAGHDLVGQAATGTGKTAAFALPILNGLDITGGAPGAGRHWCWCRRGSWRCRSPRRSSSTAGCWAFTWCRSTAASRSGASCRRSTAACTWSSARRARPRPHRPGVAASRPSAHRGARRSRRDARHGLRRRHRVDPAASCPTSARRCCSRRPCPPRITGIAKRYLRDPVRITIARADTSDEPALVTQRAYVVQRAHKAAALGPHPRHRGTEGRPRLLPDAPRGRPADRDDERARLPRRGAARRHGSVQRDRVMGRLRDGTAELLIATDVAARGLDVDVLTHVVNYDVPSAAESYVHRIGRVGRAGREGVAITMAEPREKRQLANIERLTKQKITIEQVPSVADLRARQLELTVAADPGGDGRRRPRRLPERARCADRRRPDPSAIAAGGDQAGARGERGHGRRAEIPDSSTDTDRPERARPRRPHRSAGARRAPVAAGRGDDATGVHPRRHRAARAASGRPTSSGRSPTRAASPAARSDRSGSPSTPPSSVSPASAVESVIAAMSGASCVARP